MSLAPETTGARPYSVLTINYKLLTSLYPPLVALGK